jgi:uracil-DNA glycosylase family 4
MISIKNSFADCSVCPLLDCPSCILETNCKDDLSKVDIVFVAENPGKDEVSNKPEAAPLVGRAGKMFRKYFRKYKLDKQKYLLTNTVLCQTLNPDGTTGNPTDDVIERCKVNCMEMIRACKPKLIVLMGASPMKAFGIAKAGITNLREQMFEWEDIPLILTVHPSFVNRNVKLWEPKFEEDIARVAQIMESDLTAISIKKSVEVVPSGKGIFRYKIPDKFYTDEYRLVDVQFLTRKNQVLYIFRDKQNNKIYHTEDDSYVCYQAPEGVEARTIVPYDKLNQVRLHYRDRYNLDPKITYEGDLKITTKHAMDYYHYNKGDAPRVSSNIMFFDIEVDTGKDRVFPRPQLALYPINMITTIYNGAKTHYVVDNKTEPIEKLEGVTYKIFKNEKQLLNGFMKDFKDIDPDFISGWNAISFDLAYIFTRLPKLGMPQTGMTKFGEFYVDASKYICHMPGCVAIDQDFMYRTFTFTKMENYKLAFISQHELGVSKIQLPLPFNEMYWKMLNKTIEYNIRDTDLLDQLENKLKHINLMNELRIICNTSFDSVSSMGQIDSLMVSYLREKGIASRNADPHTPKEKYPGAYVYEPEPGIYEDITDFDFASLYPSLMITYNIGVNTFVMKLKDPQLGYELAYCPEKLPEKIEIIMDPLYEKKSCIMTYKELYKYIQDHALVYTINGCFFKNHKEEFSVFGEVVELLLGSRKEYKGQMFDAIEKGDKDKENFFFTRQLVYKVLANTLYGVVANKSFRFFDLSLAAAITLGGQEALKTSIIEGDAIMKSLATEKPYKKPKTLTKAEMFADPKKQPALYKLPDRSREFIVTGDTDSIFCKFENFPQEKTVKSIHNWCGIVEKFLNEDKIIEVVKRHNVDLDFNRLKLKNELVISRGIFLAKKRYAIRVINNEGKDVDKINYMGVEIKRSDYPSKSKEFLSQLSELLLKSEKISFPKIMKFIEVNKRDFADLIKEGNKTVARPVSWGKELKDYKTIPQGVRAMQAWNSIMYDIHKTGVKGYMYWVKGVDIDKAPSDVLEKYHNFIANGEKLEVIAIPDEEEKLPHYFIPDLHAALKFTFEDRYELFLKPLFDSKEKEKNEVILF